MAKEKENQDPAGGDEAPQNIPQPKPVSVAVLDDSKRMSKLERQIAETEQKNQDLSAQIAEIQKGFEGLKRAPSPVNPQKSLFDEVIGFFNPFKAEGSNNG